MSEPSPIILSAPDAGSRSAGEALRVAREAQGLTLEGLAATIKVAPAKLKALEQGAYERLPDANFTRALAMTVCRALKLDPATVLASLPAARPIPLATGKPPLNQPFKESRGGSPLFDRHLNLSSFLAPKWLAPATLLLGAILVYALPDSIVMPEWVTRLVQVSPRSSPPVVADAASAPELAAPSSVPEPELGLVAEVPPSSVVPAASTAASMPGVVPLVLDSAEPGSSAAMAPPSATLVVDPRLAVAPQQALALSATDTSWVEVRDASGGKILSRQVEAGESLSLAGTPPLHVRIGNASGVQLNFKGQQVDLAPYTRNNVTRVELK